MAFFITSLANYNENGGPAASKTTGTLSIPANSVILVFGHGSYNTVSWNDAVMGVSDSVNGTSGWTGLDSQVGLGTGFAIGGGRAFYRSFTSGASLTITVSRDTGDVSWGYSVVAVTGHNTASPIVQAKGAGTQWGDSGNAHSQAATLASAPTLGNAVVSFLGCNNDADGAATQPSGYTSLSAPIAQFQATSVAYHTSTTTASVNWPDCGESIQYAVTFAVEVSAPPPADVDVAWLTA